MFAFNIKKGIPIAQVNEGLHDGSIIKLIPEDDDSIEKIDKNIETSDFMYPFKVNKKKGYFKNIELSEGTLDPIPNPEKRECLYIAGPSGSGKSTYASHYIKKFKIMFPKRKIYVFSRLNEDEEIDKHKPIRILLNEELLEDPISTEELKNSLCLFDDIDTIQNKQIKNCVKSLLEDILETGRHQNIYCIVTSHLMTNYKDTRIVLNESTSITFFVKSGDTYFIRQYLQKYGGLSKKQIDDILALNSRWVTLYKHYPKYILYQRGCYLL